MDFKEAMDAVGVTAVELGEELGSPAQSIRQARLDPDNANYRPPPQGWEKVLARLARERCPDLKRLAELDEGGSDA